MENIIQTVENSRINKKFEKGLSSYTQANCQVTLTDRGYRIYRPANLVHNSSTMHNMWGGLRIQPYSMENRDVLVKGHTYIIKFHAEGVSSGSCATGECGWSNNMGWGGGGLMPTPTNVSYQLIPANFNGSMECFYKWTISDDVYKTCTTAYSSFVAGNKYLSYRDFAMSWNYSNTGALGTDVYLTNFRMYDITNIENASFPNTGMVKGKICENSDYSKISIYADGDITMNDIIEL